MPKTSVNLYEAKAHLAKLIDQAISGEDVIIGRRGKAIARLTRLVSGKRVIKFGLLKGKVKVAKDFDAPLPKSALTEFEDR
jgi:prevent-host-death family protein